ncbi:helix-turn-helix transcriptional regulator [Shouchella patagoniensis]|uniref:helix-turn-helix transcriptional regulator n=1 Tax=Shouchella patagoniensis TaxID=228576 RepID=UPI00099499A3|nr:helix-turn-helix transcriptional regulator [Shouchella patagoniensis]
MKVRRYYHDPNQLMIDLRKEKGLTQQELANRLSVSQTMVAEVEAGRKQFTEEKQAFTAFILGATAKELFPERIDRRRAHFKKKYQNN